MWSGLSTFRHSFWIKATKGDESSRYFCSENKDDMLKIIAAVVQAKVRGREIERVSFLFSLSLSRSSLAVFGLQSFLKTHLSPAHQQWVVPLKRWNSFFKVSLFPSTHHTVPWISWTSTDHTTLHLLSSLKEPPPTFSPHLLNATSWHYYESLLFLCWWCTL